MSPIRTKYNQRKKASFKMGLFILFLSWYIVGVWSQEVNITCSMSPVKPLQGEDVVLTYHFPEDLSVTRKEFTIYRYITDGSSDAIVDCWWIKGILGCFTKPGFEYNKSVNTQLAVTIRNVTSVDTGSYAFQIAGYGPTASGSCQLKSMEKIRTITKEEPQSNATLTVVIVLSTLLSGAGVVAAAVILFLTYRRKCLSSSKRKAEDHEKSTPMTPLVKKKEEERTEVTDEYLAKEFKEMYPDMTGTFYFVPPVYFNKTRYILKNMAEEVIWVPDNSTENDFRHDRAMQHVMHCLRHLAEHGQEKMFVLTQFSFDDYLDYITYLLDSDDSFRNSSDDLLIIHKKHGVLVGVVKTVSDDDVRSEVNHETLDKMITSQVKEGMEQLEKAVSTIKYITSDLKPVKIHKALMMPRLSRSSLMRAVDQLPNCSDIEMSVCADDLSDLNSPWDISSDQLNKLVQRWNKVMEKINDDHDMTEELYLKLISRFCGPATQLSVQIQDKPFLLPKTLAEAVSVTGDLYNRLTLSQDIVDLLSEERLLLIGPPNTGKTRLLTLAGKKWIKSGHDLHVFYGSTEPRESLIHAFCEDLRPATVINDNAKYSPHRANIKHLNFDNEKEINQALTSLIAMKRKPNVYVVADEVDVDGKNFRKFCKSLQSKCPDVHLWATGSKLKAAIDGWKVKIFTRPANCPPAVVRECPLPKANYCIPDVKSEQPDNLYPTDGPPVKYIYHKKDGVITSHDCKECGKEVAKFLNKHLFERNDKNVLSGPFTTNATKKFSVLQDKDLLVLFESGMKQGEKFVEGLTESGIAVDTFSAKNDKDIIVKETGSACAMHVDQLYKSRPRRKIVVYVESKSEPPDLSLKWRAMTSCTSQLIVVQRNR